ncbi:MAG: YcxB family protein [Phycisphaerae bacterium]|jgi:hypothetical protein
MEIEVDITRKDFVKFNQYVLKHKRVLKYKLIFPLALVFLVVLSNIKKNSDVFYIVTQIFLILIIYYVVVFLSKPLVALSIKYLPSEKGGVLGKHKFKISDEGLQESTEHNESLVRWDGIQTIETTKDYFFVFVDTHMAHLIPIRCFNSVEESKTFLDALKSRVDAAKKQNTIKNI